MVQIQSTLAECLAVVSVARQLYLRIQYHFAVLFTDNYARNLAQCSQLLWLSYFAISTAPAWSAQAPCDLCGTEIEPLEQDPEETDP